MLGEREMPSTIVVGNDDDATRYPQQSKVFRNPRGLNYYYAVITTSTGIHLYKSSDGTTWTYVVTFNADSEFIGSLELYDDGSRLIVYLAYGQSTNYIWIDPIYYRRLVIEDDASDPVVGAQQTAVASDIQGHPVIRRDRNGYVHIAFCRNRDYTVKGTTYNKSETWLVGTTTTNPGDSPSWCTPVRVEAHPDIDGHTRHAKCSLTVFGGTGDIGGVVYAIDEIVDTTNYGRLKGCDIVSFNGTSFSLGTPTIIDTIPRVGYMNASQFDLYEGFKVIADSSNYAHTLYRTEVTNERLRHRKATASNTVESWEAYNVVDDSNTVVFTMGLVLAIDKSVTPNDLYAFYIFRFYENTKVRWRKTPVDTISWSDETTISDDTNRIVDIGAWYREAKSALHIIYSYYNSPYTTRYIEFTLVAPVIIEHFREEGLDFRETKFGATWAGIEHFQEEGADFAETKFGAKWG